MGDREFQIFGIKIDHFRGLSGPLEIMPQERVGVTLGAQVRHVATYRDPLRGPIFTPFLPKSVRFGPKRGYPLFLTGFELAPPA